MIIANKLENEYKNFVNLIKTCKDKEQQLKMIGTLAIQLGKGCISTLSRVFKKTRKVIRKAIKLAKGEITYRLEIETRGRKKIVDKFPELKSDISKIVENNLSVEPRFKTEKQYVRLTVNEIKMQLMATGKYQEKDFSNSSLNNILNKMGFNLKKVKKIEPLKKIEQTDIIFENVHKKKEEALNDINAILISIDTKDKVLIGPFSRNGKNRIQIKAVDHELTNKCLIPFGILDLKTNIPYFFNFTSKPTSLDLVDCIEEFYKEQYLNNNKTKLAILLDNGPDNSGVRTTFLKGLIEFSKRAKIIIELIYYPPYHSKYNPVERLWARIENIWNGYLLTSIDICLNFMKNLTWKNTPSIVKLKDVQYEKGLIVNKKEMLELENYYITRNPILRKWSIMISP